MLLNPPEKGWKCFPFKSSLSLDTLQMFAIFCHCFITTKGGNNKYMKVFGAHCC